MIKKAKNKAGLTFFLYPFVLEGYFESVHT